MLRNFGEFIPELQQTDHGTLHSELRYRRAVIDLLLKYCSGTLIELTLVNIKFTYGITILTRPLFERLQKLDLGECRFSELSLEMLPLWAPELRELNLIYYNPCEEESEHESRFNFLHQPFPKLTRISLTRVPDLRNHDVGEMLKLNYQLKAITSNECKHIDGHVFQALQSCERRVLGSIKKPRITHYDHRMWWFGRYDAHSARHLQCTNSANEVVAALSWLWGNHSANWSWNF